MTRTRQAGNFIESIFPILNAQERRLVETAIVSIPQFFDKKNQELAEATRNRLIGYLLAEKIESEELKKILKELLSQDKIRSSKSDLQFIGVQTSTYGEEEYLAGQGVPVETEPNRRIRDIETPIKEFSKKHLNSTPR